MIQSRASERKWEQNKDVPVCSRSSQSLLDGSVATCGVCICIASFHNILDIASILASNVFMCIYTCEISSCVFGVITFFHYSHTCVHHLVTNTELMNH